MTIIAEYDFENQEAPCVVCGDLVHGVHTGRSQCEPIKWDDECELCFSPLCGSCARRFEEDLTDCPTCIADRAFGEKLKGERHVQA